ncbi:MAG: helix-hairpin-helix domain-containing protein [Bacteroidales bacterium]|nr:helix-hairpin-helix domain-containing protein [Bacteroidales bacterium]
MFPYPRYSCLWAFAVIFLWLPYGILAQENDSVKAQNVEFITDQLENIARASDLNLDYTDLIDDYLFYLKNPVNLNSDEVSKLADIYLLSENQLQNLQVYKNKYRQLYSIYELKYVPGFDAESIKRLLPFVTVKPQDQEKSFKVKDIFRFGKHQLMLRYQQVPEPSSGYGILTDSAWIKPGSVYLGSPQKTYARYAFNYKNKIRFGFTMEKDAGEVFLTSKLSDSVYALVGSKVSNLFDFYSAHAYVSDMGILKEAVIGDYHLEFGQGLTLWTGLAFGKSSEALQVKRFARGIRPNTSVNENRFFRGAAVTIGLKGFLVTGFYSRNKVDAHANSTALITEETISSIQETGLHRTINELLGKDAIEVRAYGGRMAYKKRILELGATAFQTRLSASLLLENDLYKLYNFQGNSLTNYGFDLKLNFQKLNFFGEFSASSNGGMAGIAGLNTFLSDRFIFTLVYHDYGKNYQNLFANPFAESSAIANERGVYFGFRALLAKRWRLTAYLDYFRFPWLKYRVDGPSFGRDYLLQLDYNPSPKTNLYFRYRYKQKQENFSDDYDYLPWLALVKRNEFRFFVSYSVFDFLILKNRLDFVTYHKEADENESGYQVYQDILYRPARFPLEATFRYALFDTDGYNSRIYTYENDVLYAFSVPAYFDSGQRLYLMLKWKAMKQLDIWLRVARATYFQRRSIGSGSDEIDGKHKTEVKVQLKLKL